MKILFLHGWQSVPGGVKPTFLKERGHTVINPKLPDDDFEEAVRIAQEEFNRHKPDVVVGSSRGGAVAMNIESGETPLVLLCPAWKKHGTVRRVKKSTTILHSRADDVVPFSDSEELVANSGLSPSRLIEVGSDHRLADEAPLQTMLDAVNGSKTRTKVSQVKLSDLQPGPIRHESLTDEMLEQIRAVFESIGRFTGMTLEEFEIGFMRDMHPEREVAIWSVIVAAWRNYHEKFTNDETLPDEQEKKLVAALIAISSCVQDVSKLGVPPEVGRRLLACYAQSPRER
jgi:hypothetical protein